MDSVRVICIPKGTIEAVIQSISPQDARKILFVTIGGKQETRSWKQYMTDREAAGFLFNQPHIRNVRADPSHVVQRIQSPSYLG